MRCRNCGKTSRGYRRCPFCGSRGGRRRSRSIDARRVSRGLTPICFLAHGPH